MENQDAQEAIKSILAEFKDVMPPELPKKLPPRREIDHESSWRNGESLNEYTERLRLVFQALRENELYVKLEKCSVVHTKVIFLGHKVKHGKILMDAKKVRFNVEWEPLKNVSELRSFLGLVNYYQRFIVGYSARATLLTNFLKKNAAVVVEDPVLSLPNYSKPFELHTDALDYAIGGVLMHDGHFVVLLARDSLRDQDGQYD
ncbi:uncharacterized mitochondrial protein AtMg00860-like [Andrographis paniculata]|uniref:uncharacterized mitochondrial protein AtMg00860-like n=1 Tax=Andrographis paniculata TaxID=175694 RepID=UPI0021E8C607|nr:uncharacterized mitochondrial protein AtMg00860-like [Andrographis paniculata]